MVVKFYLTLSGRSPVREFLLECSKDLRSDSWNAVDSLETRENLTMPLSRNLSNIHSGLHELRLKDHTGQFRFFYFIKKGDSIYFVHAFKKKTQELPRREIEIALQRLKGV